MLTNPKLKFSPMDEVKAVGTKLQTYNEVCKSLMDGPERCSNLCTLLETLSR